MQATPKHSPSPIGSEGAQSQAQVPQHLKFDSTAANAVIAPRKTDVLYGTKYMNHPGTLRMHQVASEQLPIFESIIHRAEKTKFVGLLLQYMKASGVRLLTMDTATTRWVQVDDKIARNKAFCNKRRK